MSQQKRLRAYNPGGVSFALPTRFDNLDDLLRVVMPSGGTGTPTGRRGHGHHVLPAVRQGQDQAARPVLLAHGDDIPVSDEDRVGRLDLQAAHAVHAVRPVRLVQVLGSEEQRVLQQEVVRPQNRLAVNGNDTVITPFDDAVVREAVEAGLALDLASGDGLPAFTDRRIAFRPREIVRRLRPVVLQLSRMADQSFSFQSAGDRRVNTRLTAYASGPVTP